MAAFPTASIARPLRRALALILLLAATPQAAAAESVQALRYGVTLYHLYQQDYFESLTELMVAQRLDQLGPHTENAELLRGGISLSYGMDREAERIFAALLAEPREGVDRDRAWFYLAKLAWQRGNSERAALALAQVSALQSPQLNDEVAYLRSALQLRAGDFEGASRYASSAPENSPWLAYHHYNMGAAHASSGEWLAAVNSFRALDGLELHSEDARTLRDRAHTASGYALVAAGYYDQAINDFTRVRLHSPMAERALLGYGWAASELQDYPTALSPWQALSLRDPVSPSVREGLLAMPYLYEKMGREHAALAGYQDAAAIMEAELAAVRAAMELFRTGDLPALLDLRPTGSGEWLFGNDILPVNEQAPYLKHVIASHGFQGAMKELRDLYSIAGHLARADERLKLLTVVDAEQQQTWGEVIEGERQRDLQRRHQALLGELVALREKLERAQGEVDGRALADAGQLALWQRWERASRLAGELQTTEEQRHRLALYRGLLLWEDSEQYADRLWRAERQLAELEALADESAAAIARVDEAIAARQFSSFLARIEALQRRLAGKQQRVQLALLQSQDEIRQVVLLELEQQAGRLAQSLGQSRLAVARLYDRGSTGLGQ